MNTQQIEATKDNSQKLYQCYFTGKKVGSIGESSSYRSVVMAGSPASAQQKLYLRFEHISKCEIEEAQAESTDIALKLVEIFKLWNNHLPTISDFEECETKDTLRIGLWREGTISTIWANLNDRLSIQLGRNGKRDTFSITYAGSYHSKNHGVLFAGDSISINVSIDKSAEQIVRDIKTRIFQKQAAEIAKISIKLEELKAKDNDTDKNYNYLSKVYQFHNGDKKSCYAGECKLNIEAGYITIAMRQQYFSTEEASTAVKIAEILNGALARIEKLTAK